MKLAVKNKKTQNLNNINNSNNSFQTDQHFSARHHQSTNSIPHDKGLSIAESSKNEFTKVILKIIIEPVNHPLRYGLKEKYEKSLEYIYAETKDIDINKTYHIDGLKFCFNEVFRNMVENTNFAITEKHYIINFQDLADRLGYPPDNFDFNRRVHQFLEYLILNIQSKVINDLTKNWTHEELMDKFTKCAS